MENLVKAAEVSERLRDFYNRYGVQILTGSVAAGALYSGVVDPLLSVALLGSFGIVLPLILSQSQQLKVKKLTKIIITTVGLAAIWVAWYFAPRIDCASPIPKVIEKGEIDVFKTGCYAVGTENEAEQDFLERVSCPAGVRFDLIQADPKREVVVGGKQPRMMFESAFHLNHPGDLLQLECRRANVVYQINRSNGGSP